MRVDRQFAMRSRGGFSAYAGKEQIKHFARAREFTRLAFGLVDSARRRSTDRPRRAGTADRCRASRTAGRVRIADLRPVAPDS